jgi:hypothetical protein
MMNLGIGAWRWITITFEIQYVELHWERIEDPQRSVLWRLDLDAPMYLFRTSLYLQQTLPILS